jgi:hypothetical protein
MAPLTTAQYVGNPMNGCREPTLPELLSDSIVKAVMKADGVDPTALEAQLRSMARDLATIRRRCGRGRIIEQLRAEARRDAGGARR